MLQALSALLYIVILLPIWAVRRILGLGRFERRFHGNGSAWDLPPRFGPPVE